MFKYYDRTPGLFKAEFQGTRMIALTCKCYYAENAKSKPKFSCKGVSKRQNPMSWERYYLEALNGSINRASKVFSSIVLTSSHSANLLARYSLTFKSWSFNCF